jgi:quinol monooxygenase YgiN
LPADQRATRPHNVGHREDIMPASLRVSACLVPALAAVLLLCAPGPRIAAQPAGLYINAVDLDINPADIDAFLAALKENGANSVNEPGCREFNIHVKADNPNHVFIYEIYDSAAALEAHRATDHFKKYAATTQKMVAKREARPMTSVALNYKAK